MIATRLGGPPRSLLSRSFFASSTDHTRLLKDAKIHCLPLDGGKKQYVLAPDSVGLDMVTKVPQLHLARIYLDGSKIYGAKVVNRTLGSIPDVCGRLLEAALSDGGKEAHAALHGMSEWVQKGKLVGRKESETKILEEIANGILDNYDDALWQELAMEYAASGIAGEAKLYAENNGTLISIAHKADVSEFANTSGGAMAIFRFQ